MGRLSISANKRESCRERIPINTYNDFCTVRNRFIGANGEPINSGFESCFSVGSFDKNMKYSHLIYKTIHHAQAGYDEKENIAADRARKLVDDCCHELEGNVEKVTSNLYEELLSLKKFLDKPNLPADEAISEVNHAFYDIDAGTCVEIEDSIDKFDKNIKTIKEYLRSDECPYHEKMDDEVIDKVLKSCIFSISGYDTQFVYPRAEIVVNLDDESMKIFEIVRFLAKKLKEDNYFNNFYKAFSDKKVSMHSFFNFDLNMFLTENNFKDNVDNKNDFLDLFLKSHHNSYFTTYFDMGLGDEDSYETSKYIFGYYVYNMPDHINHYGLFNDVDLYASLFGNYTKYYYNEDNILHFCMKWYNHKVDAQEVARCFVDRIIDMYKKYNRIDLSEHRNKLIKMFLGRIEPITNNIEQMKKSFVDKLDSETLALYTKDNSIIYNDRGIERIKINSKEIKQLIDLNPCILDKLHLKDFAEMIHKN